LAFVGVYLARRNANEPSLFLTIWLLAGILLVYFPSPIQRRFISGLYVPVAALAVFALHNLARNQQTLSRLALAVVFFSVPTNLLILYGGAQAARAQNSALYLERAELAAYHWLDRNAMSTDMVLAAPESGLYIPAYSDVRVIYGHPFETVQADARRAEVQSFYTGQLHRDELVEYLRSAQVDYVFYGPRERALGPLPELPGWQVVYSADGVEIWAPSL